MGKGDLMGSVNGKLRLQASVDARNVKRLGELSEVVGMSVSKVLDKILDEVFEPSGDVDVLQVVFVDGLLKKIAEGVGCES